MAEQAVRVDFSGTFVDLPTRRSFQALSGDFAVTGVSTATETLDFGSIAANISIDLTVTVNGARANDICHVAPPAAPDAEIAFTAFVSADDTVTVRAGNHSAGAVNPASALYRVMVVHFN